VKRVIIEGVDGSGKTTLIEKLRREFHFLTPVVNTLRSEQDFEKWWPEVLSTDYGDRVPIHDRFYYSELVYGPILRGNSIGSKALHLRVRNQLRREAFLVHARPTLGSITQEAQVSDQMEGVLDHLPELLNGYDSIMKMQPIYYGNRFLTYDWHYKSDYLTLVDRLERYLLGS